MSTNKAKRKSGYNLLPIFAVLSGIVITATVSLSIGSKYNLGKSKSDLIVEAAKGGVRYGSDITDSYATCEGFKTNNTDITSPSISIIKPVNGEKISGIKGDGIVWVTMKATDESGLAYPNLYVNGQVGLAWINLIKSPEYPGAMTGYIHVQPNQTYTLKAKACDSGGNESWSSPVVINISSK